MEKKTKLSSEITNSGKKAKKTGNNLERIVEETLISEGSAKFDNHKEQFFANRTIIGGKQYQSQLVTGETIYRTPRKVDFFVINKKKFEDDLIIECKWQQSAGSVDEKYPYLIFNIMKTGVPTIIILDGDAYKPAAKEWLEQQAQPKRSLIGVWNLQQFQKNVNNGFLG